MGNEERNDVVKTTSHKEGMRWEMRGNVVGNERECGSNYGGWCVPNNKYIEVFDILMFPYSYYLVSLHLRMER